MIMRVDVSTMTVQYSVFDTVVIYVEYVCCSVVFSVIWSELLMTSTSSCPL